METVTQSESNQRPIGIDYESSLRNRVRERLLSFVTWTKAEQAWINEDNCPQELSDAVLRRIKGAATGCFVSNWNFGQELDICETFSRLDLEKLEGRVDGWCENEEDMLRNLLQESPTGFSWYRLVHHIPAFRFCRLQISGFDDYLSQLRQIKCLIFSSNLLNDHSGSLLPRDLRFLELYNNSFNELNQLGYQAPPKLLYLGLGRNKFSTCESLRGMNKFINLCYIDLSDNDIKPECIAALKELPSLKTISLYGTPYSMAISYKRSVVKELSKLIYLDGVDLKMCSEESSITEINKTKKKPNDVKSKSAVKKNKKVSLAEIEESFDLTGELLVYCFKVFGVVQPKGPKNIKHLYYCDLECPLIDGALKEFLTEQIRDEDETLKQHLLDLEMGGDFTFQGLKGVGFKDSISGKPKGKEQIGDMKSKLSTTQDRLHSKSKTTKDTKLSDKEKRTGNESSKKLSKDSRKSTMESWKGAMESDKGKRKCKQELDTDNTKLHTLSKKCSDRHKFSENEQWEAPIKRCFLFGPTQMQWKSRAELIKSEIDAGIGEEKSKKSTMYGSELDYNASAKGAVQGSIHKADAAIVRKDTREGGIVQEKDFKKGKDKNLEAEYETDKSKKSFKKPVPLKKGSKRQIYAGQLEESQQDVMQNESGKLTKVSKKNLAEAKLKLKLMVDQFSAILERDVEIEGRSSRFRTKEIEWARVLEFKQPISVKTTDLASLRDTFKTIVKLRLFHITKIKGKKTSYKRKDKDDFTRDPDVDVLTKEKLAVITIPLEMIRWNEHFLSYTWDFDNPCMAEKHPNVKEIKFAKGDWTKKTNRVELPPEPQILTMHIGVGLRRDVYE